jgi:hypothetical protein
VGAPPALHGGAAGDLGLLVVSSAHKSFGWVVMMVKLRIRSPAGERHVSHNPAMPISRRSLSAIA